MTIGYGSEETCLNIIYFRRRTSGSMQPKISEIANTLKESLKQLNVIIAVTILLVFVDYKTVLHLFFVIFNYEEKERHFPFGFK